MANDLRPGPPWLYPAKAALTRARSLRWLAATRGRPQAGGLRILFYHRVAADRDELAVDPSAFRRQMELLARQGYRAVGLVEAVDRLAAGAPDGRIVGLTFDDGYRDVAENALPVLAGLGFEATVFVATGVVDGTASFRWYRRQPPVLGWAEIEGLDREGTLRFEAHTVTHPNLVTLSERAARDEILGSRLRLEDRLGRPVSAFCYPGGVFGERDRRLVAESGFRLAASCEPGLNTPGFDPLALRRTQIDGRDGLLDFRAKVAGGHDVPPPLRAAYRRLRYGAGAGSPRSASSAR